MALLSPAMLLFEKALSLTPEEWLHLRQWMFSTTYQDASRDCEDRTRSQYLHSIDVTSQHAEKTSTITDGKVSASAAASGELLLEDPSRDDAVGLKFLASPKAEIPLHATSIPVETSKEDAAARSVGDIPASVARSFTTHGEALVAPVRTDRRVGGAKNISENPSAVPRREAAARGVRRKRMRKQLGVLPLVREKCEGQPPDVDFRPSPTKKNLKTSATAALNKRGAFYKAAPTSSKVRAAARHEAVADTDLWSEIVEEDAGLWRVSVRKGNACITKRFSAGDSSDRLPELVLHLDKICPREYLGRSSATPTASRLEAVAPAAAAAERTHNPVCHLGAATRTTHTANAGEGIPNTPPFSTLPHSCESMDRAYEDSSNKHSKAYGPTATYAFLDDKSATGAAGRAEAGAKLYCDWVCKHFDQVHHYLSISKSYVQPDARSRERAASLALQLLLSLPQDTEQQRYLQWITSFLNASSPGATAVPECADKKHLTLQQKSPPNAPYAAAVPAVAPFTSTPPSMSQRTPQSASCTTGSARCASGARTSPCSTTTPSPTKASSSSEATRSDAVVTPYDVSSSVSRLPKKASSTAVMAAQLLESLCLLDSRENKQDGAEFLQPAFDHASTAPQPNGSGGSFSNEKLVHTGEEGTELKASRRLGEDGEETSSFQSSGDHNAVAVTAAVSTAHHLRDANRHAEAVRYSAAGTATAAEPTKLPAARLRTAAAAAARLPTTASAGTTATTPAVRPAAVDDELAIADDRRAPTTKAAARASPDDVRETPGGEAKAEVAKAASEAGASATAEVGADAAVHSPTSAGAGVANYSVAHATGSTAEGEASREIGEAVASVWRPRVPTAAAGKTAFIDPCGVVGESKNAQRDLESRASTSEEMVVQHSCKQPTQLGCLNVLSAEGLSDEMMEAARALVGSLSREKEAMAWMEQNNFSSILQMLQTALEEPAVEAQQHSQLHGQQQHPVHARKPVEQEALSLPIIQQQEEKNHCAQQQQEGAQHSLQRQQNAPHPVHPHQEEHEPQKQQREQHVKALQQRSDQQQQECFVQQSETSAPQPQPCDAWGQRQGMGKESEPSAELGGSDSICTLLYSLLQKRLPPASDAFLYQDDALLQETSLSYNDTDCSSQNSRKVSSCAEESLVQTSNSFMSQANEAFSASGESSSQAATQAVCGPCESAAASRGVFPCFLEESISLPAADFSFPSRVTSSTSACASSSLGDVCWPPCNSSNHLKQEHAMQEEASIPSKRGFDLPDEEPVHRRGRAAIFNNHAPAAAVVG